MTATNYKPIRSAAFPRSARVTAGKYAANKTAAHSQSYGVDSAA